MVGCGGVCTALFELFNKQKLYLNNHFVIIEPCDIGAFLFKDRKGKVKHIKKSITPDNIEILLKDVDNKSIIVDLSIGVNFLPIAEWAIKKKAMYINTSLENWDEFTEPLINIPDNYKAIKAKNLYHRQILADKILGKSKKTICTDCGANPGSDNLLVINFLKDYADENNIKFDSYAELARDIGIEKILYTEKDTQRSNIKPRKDTFYNTWSPGGMQAEMLEPVMISQNNNKPHVKNFIYPDEGQNPRNISFLPVVGMNLKEKSIVLNDKGRAIENNGFLIPHNEINTLSRVLTVGDYTPVTYYVYEMSPIARESIENVRKNKYKPLPNYYLLKNQDIISGYDSLGALIKFKDGREYWSGFVQNKAYIDKNDFFSGSTMVQVASFVNSTIKWMLKNQNEGYITPEYLPLSVLHDAKKFMGKFYTKLVSS
jgi:homospermidine synthase